MLSDLPPELLSMLILAVHTISPASVKKLACTCKTFRDLCQWQSFPLLWVHNKYNDGYCGASRKDNQCTINQLSNIAESFPNAGRNSIYVVSDHFFEDTELVSDGKRPTYLAKFGVCSSFADAFFQNTSIYFYLQENAKKRIIKSPYRISHDSSRCENCKLSLTFNSRLIDTKEFCDVIDTWPNEDESFPNRKSKSSGSHYICVLPSETAQGQVEPRFEYPVLYPNIDAVHGCFENDQLCIHFECVCTHEEAEHMPRMLFERFRLCNIVVRVPPL